MHAPGQHKPDEGLSTGASFRRHAPMPPKLQIHQVSLLSGRDRGNRPWTATAALWAVFLLWCSSAFAYNHPEIKWKSVTTEHFVINYYSKTEPALYAVWKIAEEAYGELAKLYDYEPRRRIALSLADYDDYSNGWAAWLEGSIMIWVPDARFDLRGNSTWLANVITHELTHIMSLAKKKRFQVVDWSISAGYASPTMAVEAGLIVPRMTFYPNWLAEGVAQMGAEHMGHDCWDSRRDMILRCAILEEKQLTLAEMGHFNHNALGNEMVYNQGYSLSRFIARRVGVKKLRQVMIDGNDDRLRFSRHFRYRTGHTLEQLYRKWVSKLTARYSSEMPQQPTATEPVWTKGFINLRPRVSPDGAYWGWLTNHRDDSRRTDLVIARYGTSDVVRRIKYARSSWDFSADGTGVFFVRSRNPNRNGSYLNDIFAADIDGGRIRRLTRNARVYDIAASPDGKKLAVTRYREGAYTLELFVLGGNRLERLDKGRIGAPYMSPCFDPDDPARLCVVRVVEGKAGIYAFDTKTAELTPIAVHRAQEESPCWGTDGRIYFSADYDGVFNVYSVLPDGSGLSRHSNVGGGLFAPSRGTEKTLLCSEYSAEGFGIVSFAPVQTPYELPESYSCSFDDLPRPKGRVRVKSRQYSREFRPPAWEFATTAYVEEGDTANDEPELVGIAATSLAMSRNDALGKRLFQFAVAAGIIGARTDTSVAADTSIPAQSLKDARAAMRRYARPRRELHRDIRSGRHSVRDARRMLRDLRTGPRARQSGDSAYSPENMAVPFVGPSLSMQNNSLAASFGFDLTVVMPLFIPSEIQFAPYVERQFGRGLYAGVTAITDAFIFAGEYSVQVPVWVSWVNNGYYRRNINYTLGNVTIVQLIIDPMLIPVPGLLPMLSARHGFALGRYCSLTLGGEALAFLPADQQLSTGGGGSTLVVDDYLETGLSSRFVFPIIPEINRGKRLYFDALYGSVAYRASGASHDEPVVSVSQGDMWEPLRTGKVELGGRTVYLNQRIELALEAAVSKAYLFQYFWRASVAYDFTDEELFVKASAQF